MMEQDFVYWRHRTPIGIKVEEISGGARYGGGEHSTWVSLARQVYCENGRDGFRGLEYYDNGAPYLSGELTRISITHTEGLYAVATLPKTPEVDLRTFAPRAAVGIDAERRDREQVLRVRERFLSPEEMAFVPAEDVAANITAWTAKEALLKAALNPAMDIRGDIRIQSLPTPMPVRKGANGKPLFEYTLGKAEITVEGKKYPMELFCYDSDDCRVTIAYSPKCAKFIRNAD